MNDSDRVSAAAGELYSADPDVFTGRRRELAAQARAAGDRAAAKTIAAFGKPTRSAWVVNKLVRADPSVPARLAELGDRLRVGEAALDGTSIRELSLARRHLIDSLVRQALAESGQRSASAAMRDEVTETFSAALADPGIAGQVAAGTLVRAAHWAGFGPGIGTAAPSGPAPPRPRKAASSKAASSKAESTKASAPAQDEAQDDEAQDEARAQAERVRQRQQAVAAAEEAVARASGTADTAKAAEQERAGSVQAIEQHLTDERRLLSHARIATRQADSALQRARQALWRLRRQSS